MQTRAGAPAAHIARRRQAGRPPGRPTIRLPPDGLDRIRKLAAQGHSELAISYQLGLARDGIQKLKQRPGGDLIERALFEGRQEEHQCLYARLFETATQGTGKEAVTAAIFLLKARHGYIEARDALPAPTVNVQIRMPGAMRPDDYSKLIEQVQSAPRPLLQAEQAHGTEQLPETHSAGT